MQYFKQFHSNCVHYQVLSGYCPTMFDSILCWPKTKAGTLASLQCLEEFRGVHYDTSSENQSNHIPKNPKINGIQLCNHQTMQRDFATLTAPGITTPTTTTVPICPTRHPSSTSSQSSSCPPSFITRDTL